ncbi:hypothetical protein IJG78_03325 [Candidatus Saccharibacteria bacterium]|nr:hypothetical protein [Candidatus Saccharibacteria bacterium]
MRKYRVISETSPSDPPKDFEMRAAIILANYLRKDLIFQRPGHRRSPDLREKGSTITWELKSPTGDGKKTIDNNLRSAKGQSKRIVLDLTRCKMHQTKVISRVRYYTKVGNHQIERLLILTKARRVIDFFKDIQ